MFLKFYNLQRQPFGVAPDSHFLYLSPQHREALASLLYGTETDRGFLALIALPGMGKTTLLYDYLSTLGDSVRTAFVFRTDCESSEFVRYLISDLGIDCAGLDLQASCDAFHRFVAKEAESGRQVVLVIDEAHNLDEKTLESIRLLANFETVSGKSLLIVLAGQPRLASRLAQNSLLQLRQRISMAIKIAPFDYVQTVAYIDHRLQKAGGRDSEIFSEGARRLVAEHSRGIPRCINNICFNAMSLGCAERIHTIGHDVIRQVVADMDMESLAETLGQSVVKTQSPTAKTMNSGPVQTIVSAASRSLVCADPGRQGSLPKDTNGLNLKTESLNSAGVDESNVRDTTIDGKAVPVARISSRRTRLGLSSKLAAACAFSLAIGTSNGSVERKAPKALTSSAPSSDPTPLEPAAITNVSDRLPIVRTDVIRVHRGQTVYGICIHMFGRYDQTVLQHLRELNPWFKGPCPDSLRRSAPRPLRDFVGHFTTCDQGPPVRRDTIAMSKNFELMQQAMDRREDWRPAIVRPQHPAVSPSTEISTRVAVEAFCRHWKLFCLVSLAVLLLTTVYTVCARRQYRSEMKLLVQNARENVVVTPERTNSATVAGDVTEAQVNSEIEILHSHDVIDKVADPGWESDAPASKITAAIRRHEKLLASFEKRLSTDVVRKTNVINVAIVDDSSEKARADLEELAATYLAEHRRLQRPPGSSEFFASEAERARKDWDAATQRLVDFQHSHQLLSVSDREAFLDHQISEGENALFLTASALDELDAELDDASRKLRVMPSRQVTQQKTAPGVGSTQQLTGVLVELENKRTSLLTNYKENDRLVHELDEQIATTESALTDAKTASMQEETTDVDPAWQQVHSNYVQNQITHRALAKRQEALDKHISSLRQDLLRLQDTSVQYNNLQSQADELKENYQLYLQKRDQAQIEDAMDEHKMLNVAVAELPTASSIPVKPRPMLNILLGCVTGVFLSICVIYFAETGRNTIGTPRELDLVSSYPVLATVAEIPAFDIKLTGRTSKALRVSDPSL